MTEEFPNLMQFLGSYFHQDWFLEAHSANEVLQQYASHEPKCMILAVIAEIDKLLGADDHVVDGVIEASGFYYDPSADGLSIREWLGKAKEALQIETAQ